MSTAPPTPLRPAFRPPLAADERRDVLLVAPIVLLAALLAMRGAYLALLAPLLLAGAAWLLWRRPDAAVPCFAFLLYTNSPAVAAQVHHVPFAIAAAVPLLLCVPIARDLLQRRLAPVVAPALPLILAFMVVQFLGALFAVRPEEAMDAMLESLFEGLALYVLVTNAIRTPAVLRQVLWSLLAAGAFMGAVVAWQHHTGRYDDNYFGYAQVDNGIGFVVDTVSEVRQPRVGGPLAMPNRFAQIMAILVPIALFQMQMSRSRLAKLAAAACLGLVMIGFSLGFSRGAAVGLAATFLVMLAMGHVSRRQLAAVAIGVGAIVVLVPQYAIRLASLATVADAVTDDGGGGLEDADSSTQGRITEMIAGALIFADHPVIGVGPEMYRRHYPEYARVAGGRVRTTNREAHSLPVHIAAEHGSLGLALFVAIFWVTLRDLVRARRRLAGRDPERALLVSGVLLALVTFLTTSVFLHASFIRYQWFLLALAAATPRALGEEREGPPLRLVRLVRVGEGALRRPRAPLDPSRR